jgi:urease accessory protein UreF
MTLNEEAIKTANALDTIKEKLAELSGDKEGALAARLRIINRSDADEAIKAIDAISDAYLRNAKAAMEALSLWNKFWTMVGNLTTSPLDKQTEEIIKKNTEIKNSFDEITSTKGLKEGASFLTEELQQS